MLIEENPLRRNQEPCAQEALDILKSDVPQIQSTDDRGLADVLQSFARSLGYVITNKPISKESRSQDVRGQIFFSPPTIYLKPTDDKVTLAETVAHELAHHYDYYLSTFQRMYPDSMFLQEQLAEAVAVAILLEYDVNRVELGRQYIKQYRSISLNHSIISEYYCVDSLLYTYKTVPDFYNGSLDNGFNVVYNRFHRDLEEFLRTT